MDDEEDGDGGLDGGEVGAGGEGWGWGGVGGEREDGRGRRKVVISQLLINILRLRAFQRNVIN